VVIAEISKETGKAAEGSICSEGGKALFVQTDVADTWSVKRLSQAVRSVFGPVDILVNNAIRCPCVPVMEMDDMQWDQVMAVNLRGTFLISKAFLPEMIERKQGVILNMVSVDAMPGLSAYIASKQGILGFSQTLALEAGLSGIKVIPFGPGMVDTPGIRSISGDLAPCLGMTKEQFLHIPLHAAYDGLMPAEHAGAATVYLALRMADEFNGQMVNGYEVLERAGLIKPTPVSPFTATPPANPDSQATSARHASPTRPASPASTASAASPGDVQKQVGKVLEILAATGKEFEKLLIFVRPMARNGFKGKSGQSLENWQRSLTAVQEKLGKGSTEGAPAVISGLDKLIEYYRGVPRETARFTRDQEMLRQVAVLSDQRIAAILQLQAGLRAVVGKS
jgi:NAD(P)-dependent dehydrogenase (short-subunit alcohol dehydrogenase family)